MICKWCGETLKTGDKTCKRCRREVPALSDCGGFYDLVPTAMPVEYRNTLSAEQNAPIQKPVTPIAPVLPDHEGQRAKRKNLILVIAVILVAGLLINTFVLNGKLSDANDTIDQLQSRLEEQEDQPSGGKPENTEPSTVDPDEGGEEEPSASTDPSGKEEDEDPTEQGNQKEEAVISAEISSETTVGLTEDQAAQLYSEPLYIELKDADGEVQVSLYLVLDQESEELTLWILEGRDEFDEIIINWIASRKGQMLDGELITASESPMAGNQLEWDDIDEDENQEYLGCRLNIANYASGSLLHCDIVCEVEGQEVVVITVSGVTLQ